MTIEVVKKQIGDFLSSEKPEVMAIRGAWGVGKTYSWSKFLLSAKNSNAIALNRYSYVSLFGINSLEALKYSLFENVVDRTFVGDSASIETFKSNTSGLLQSLGRKSLGIFKNTSVLEGFSSAIESLSFLSLNKAIICIDDLERRGSELSLKDALGLVSQLKEQKSCKVVLLLNDEREEDFADYIKYREKVIDVELYFAPTAQECARIAYDSDADHARDLSILTEKLNIRNIRVLKKIERLVLLAEPLLREYEPEISRQASQSIVLFSWCYYCHAEGAPPIDFVTRQGFHSWGIGDPDDVEKEHVKAEEWKSIISQYGYEHTDDFDMVLADGVRSGYFVEETFAFNASIKNREIIVAKEKDSVSEVWKLYHNSFDDNKEELLERLYDSFQRHTKSITPANLNGTVTLFRELGRSETASEMIDHFIAERRDEKELFNMEEINFFGDIKDDEIINKFNEQYLNTTVSEDARMILSRISGKDSWNQQDELILANTTVEEYCELFRTERGDHLSRYIRTCLQFGKFANASEQQRQIASRAVSALKIIGEESDLNRLRVRKFGIDLSQP